MPSDEGCLPEAKVLLLGSESRTTLAAARSFAKSGTTFVVVSDRVGMVASSRSVRSHVLAPHAGSDPEGYISVVLETARSTGARLAVPALDDALSAGSRYRDQLEAEGITFAAPATPAVEGVLDKRANLAMAARLGVPTPAQFEIQTVDDVPALVEALGFPIVIKPAQKGRPDRDGGNAFKWLVARDERELRDAIARHGREGEYPLFQELLRGKVVGVYCFAARGDLVAAHASVAERRALGENVLRTIIPLDPILESYARALLGELEWDGPASLSFFVTSEGRICYMETNGRFWGPLEGSIRAGWDFPRWTVSYFLDGQVPSPEPIRLGTRGCWRARDLVGLACVVRGEAWRTDRDDVRVSRAILDYVASFRPGVHADVFRLNDPLPELIEHWLAARAIARLRSRLKRLTRIRTEQP